MVSAGERYVGSEAAAGVEGPYLDFTAGWRAVELQRNIAAMQACATLLRESRYDPAGDLEQARELAREARVHEERLQRLHERWGALREQPVIKWIGWAGRHDRT